MPTACQKPSEPPPHARSISNTPSRLPRKPSISAASSPTPNAVLSLAPMRSATAHTRLTAPIAAIAGSSASARLYTTPDGIPTSTPGKPIVR